MRTLFIQLSILGLLQTYFQILPIHEGLEPAVQTQQDRAVKGPEPQLKQAAFEVLKTKNI